MDFTVNSIIDKINRGKVNLRPSYQREYVWTTRTASRLIGAAGRIPRDLLFGMLTPLAF